MSEDKINDLLRKWTAMAARRNITKKSDLQSPKDSLHIVSDSEEEAVETQSNNNARAQRTAAEKGMLPGKNGQQSAAVNLSDAQTVHQHVASSTPLRTPLTFTGSWPSPITPAVSTSPVKMRGRGSPIAESERMIVSAQRNLYDAAVPGTSKEIEKKDIDHPRRRRPFFRKLYTPKDYDDTLIFLPEKDIELKLGVSTNVRAKSSNRFKVTRTRKSRHYAAKLSGVEENAEGKADDENNMKSSDNDEIVHQSKRTTAHHQKEKTSDVQHSQIPEFRRSKRRRVKTLEYWRGERIIYKVGADRCREVEGIDPGLPSPQRVRRKRRVVHAKEIPQCVEEVSRKLVSVPYGNGMRELECFSTLRIDSDVAKCMKGNYDVYTALKVPGMSSGYIDIDPVCESHSVIESNLVFRILVGELTVTIHETAMKVRKGEIFFVPKGVSHLLRNDGEEKSILAFTKYDD